MLPPNQIQRLLEPYAGSVPVELAERVAIYVKLLMKWNRRINLTSIQSNDYMITRHFGESFFGAVSVPIDHGRLADVGSGAGFPGLAISMFRPQLFVTAFESSKRKASFLNEVRRELNLRNVSVVAERFEAPSSRLDRFDFVSMRAVGGFESLDKVLWSTLTETGKLVLWIGRKDALELQSLTQWTWEPTISIPSSSQRVILVGKPATSR